MYLCSTDLSPDLDQVELPAMFKNPSLSLHIDIGCAMGKCVHELSMR